MEITGELQVSGEEETLLDMHSVLNICNVLMLELALIADQTGATETIRSLEDRVVSMADALRDPDEAYRQIANIEGFIAEVEGTVAGLHARPDQANEFAVSLANMRSIFTVLQVRAVEITARHEHADAWVTHDIARLQQSFSTVFQAIEQNSRGGYRIVSNLAAHEEGDYLVNFDISSLNGTTVRMPAVFQDVMRDLLANARKYTVPGGTISAGLYDSGTELRWVVSDTGVGIPSEEIAHVVSFGRRGSNTQDRPTRGGGFGLTKAYHVTRQHGGRMWIESPVHGDQGTRVEIRLPIPQGG